MTSSQYDWLYNLSAAAGTISVMAAKHYNRGTDCTDLYSTGARLHAMGGRTCLFCRGLTSGGAAALLPVTSRRRVTVQRRDVSDVCEYDWMALSTGAGVRTARRPAAG